MELASKTLKELVVLHNDLVVRRGSGNTNHLGPLDRQITEIRKRVVLHFLERPKRRRQLETLIADAGMVAHVSRVRDTLDRLLDDGLVKKEKVRGDRALRYRRQSVKTAKL